MSLTTDPNDPRLTRGVDPIGERVDQAEVYLVLSGEERAAGFVRPVRRSYWHTACGGVTTMALEIAETYARQPGFYGATYCAFCGSHRPRGGARRVLLVRRRQRRNAGTGTAAEGRHVNHSHLPHCPWCERRHVATYACDAVRRYLAALRARGDSLTMPTLEFPDVPIPAPLDQPGDVLMAQLVVQGTVVQDGTGMARAGLMFTGRDHRGQPLPRWLYVDTDQHIAAAAKLVDDMAGLAIRTATRQR